MSSAIADRVALMCSTDPPALPRRTLSYFEPFLFLFFLVYRSINTGRMKRPYPGCSHLRLLPLPHLSHHFQFHINPSHIMGHIHSFCEDGMIAFHQPFRDDFIGEDMERNPWLRI